MLNWLKKKAEAAAAKQCCFNIRLNAKSLVDMAQRQASLERDVRELGKDMVLGISNGLTPQDVIDESEKAINDLEVNAEARKALDELYQEVRELKDNEALSKGIWDANTNGAETRAVALEGHFKGHWSVNEFAEQVTPLPKVDY